jgi:hypothetical protein
MLPGPETIRNKAARLRPGSCAGLLAARPAARPAAGPVVVFNGIAARRRAFAQAPHAVQFVLHRGCCGDSVSVSGRATQSGPTAKMGPPKWDCLKSGPVWRSWPALRPAARPPASRRCMAPVPACWARHWWMAIRCWAPQPAPPGTIFIARRTLINAAEAVASKTAAPTSTPLPNANPGLSKAPQRRRARSGVLRLPITQTKDSPCSPRY